jgi:outer membrane receptor protein involved in Fe transport
MVVLPTGQALPPVRVETIPPDGNLVIQLNPALVQRVTVTPGTAPHIEASPASALGAIAREDIEQRASLHLADLLENLPGAGELEEGHSVVPSLRGLARGRTLILLDGARVTAERRAGPSATYLDPFILEAVEISRGPGSVSYGSDALGGVIDARTRQPRPGSPLTFRFRGGLGAGAPQQTAGLEVGRGLERGGWLFLLRGREFDDYRSPAGDVADSGGEDAGLLARFSHEAGPGILAAGIQSDLGRDIGKPGDDARTTRTRYPREDSHRFTAAYDLVPRGGFREIGWSGFFGSYRLVTERDRLATSVEPRRLSLSDVAARDFGFRGFAARSLGPAGLRFGVDFNGRFDLEAAGSVLDFDAAGARLAETEERSIEDARRIDTALYASLEIPAGKRLTGAGGIRLDSVATRNRGGFFGDRSTRHGTLAGYLALTAAGPPGWSATAQIARGFRDPSLSDRYFRGISGRGFVTGNPDLDPETSIQADVALRYAGPRLRCALYGYRYRIEDLVERIEPAPDEFTFRNRGVALLRGVEAEVQVETGAGLTVTLAGQLVWGETLDDGSPLADIPALGGSLTLRQELRERGYLLGRLEAAARDGEPGPTEKEIPGHGTLDLGGGWRVGTGVEIRLLVRNVFDQEYPGSSDEAAALAPGRSGILTLNVEF